MATNHLSIVVEGSRVTHVDDITMPNGSAAVMLRLSDGAALLAYAVVDKASGNPNVILSWIPVAPSTDDKET